VVWSDIDESGNQLRLGISSEDAIAQVGQRLEQLGIPGDAVVILPTREPVAYSSLRDKIRPLRAGTQILGAYDGQATDNYCTYGINVTNQNDAANRYMVTA
jgi:hypothetical protein